MFSVGQAGHVTDHVTGRDRIGYRPGSSDEDNSDSQAKLCLPGIVLC